MLSRADDAALRGMVESPTSTPQQAMRARIVLHAAAGATNRQIADEVGASLPTVGHWRRRFAESGQVGLLDRSRPGRPRKIGEDQVERVLAKALEPPPDGTTQWSVRRLADATGVSPTTVHRIWRENDIKPVKTGAFQFPKDPRRIQVVGLRRDPPYGALVLCLDAPTRLQLGEPPRARHGPPEARFPMDSGKSQRGPHQGRCQGAASLGTVFPASTANATRPCEGRCAQEFLAFLNRIVSTYPEFALHVVLDDAPGYTTAEIERWLAQHQRVHFHFNPSGASWVGLIEAAVDCRKQ